MSLKSLGFASEEASGFGCTFGVYGIVRYHRGSLILYPIYKYAHKLQQMHKIQRVKFQVPSKSWQHSLLFHWGHDCSQHAARNHNELSVTHKHKNIIVLDSAPKTK